MFMLIIVKIENRFFNFVCLYFKRFYSVDLKFGFVSHDKLTWEFSTIHKMSCLSPSSRKVLPSSGTRFRVFIHSFSRDFSVVY